MTRHADEHKAWQPNADTARAFQNLPGNGWFVFVAELLHSKVPGIRNVNYLHDILVCDGEHLIGKTYLWRLHKLTELFSDQIEPSDEQEQRDAYLVIDAHTWLAKSYHHDFRRLFQAADPSKGQEGIVLKCPTAELEACLRENSNGAWQVKCRKPTKSYAS